MSASRGAGPSLGNRGGARRGQGGASGAAGWSLRPWTGLGGRTRRVGAAARGGGGAARRAGGGAGGRGRGQACTRRGGELVRAAACACEPPGGGWGRGPLCVLFVPGGRSSQSVPSFPGQGHRGSDTFGASRLLKGDFPAAPRAPPERQDSPSSGASHQTLPAGRAGGCSLEEWERGKLFLDLRFLTREVRGIE